jgi:hypothetical protein
LATNLTVSDGAPMPRCIRENKMKPGKVTQCRIECEGQDIFIIADGVKIAKRGHPGTPQAATWVSLEPGWTVCDCRDTYTDENGEEGRAIEIEYNGVRVH